MGCDRHRHFGPVISIIYIQSVWWSSRGCGRQKSLKYAQLAKNYIFVPIAMETFGQLNMAVFQFLNKLGRRIIQESDDSRDSAFLSSGCQ